MIVKMINDGPNDGPLRRGTLARRGTLSVPSSALHSGDVYDVADTSTQDADGLLAYWRLLMHRKGWIFGFVVLGGVAGVLVSLVQTPVYEARISMEVQNFNQDFLNVGKVDPTSVNYESDSYLQTVIKMIQSDALLDRVSAKVPFSGSSANTPEPGHTSVVRALLGLPQPKPQTPKEKAVRMAINSLTVRGSGMTRLLEVFCDSTDPQFAADFVNTLSAEFIQQNLEARWNSAQHVTDWLTEQLRGLKTQMEASEERLNAYIRSAGLIASSDKDNVVTQKLDQLQQELLRAQADRVAKQSRYELATTTPPDSLPDVLDDISLRDYQIRFVELRRQYAELTSALTPAHPHVKRLEAQIAELKTSAAERRANVINRIQNDYQTARRRESLLESAYAAQLKLVGEQGIKSVQYNSLKRDVDSTRELYESLLRKFKEAGVAAAMRVSNIRVVDRAKTPQLPARPNRELNLLLGLIAGLSLGTGFVFMRENVQRNLKNPGDAKFYLNVRELGLIPSVGTDPANAVLKRRLALESGSLTSSNGNGSQHSGQSTELTTWHNHSSLTAESYRSTLASILLWGERENVGRPQVILLTSPMPLDGKTTTVCNLGIATAEIMAESNQRVLLIDGDLRRPRLHKIFNIAENTGLCDLLTDPREPETCPLEGLVRKTDIPGLYVLPSGRAVGHITSLLYSARLGRFLNRFRKEFNTVLLDTPPMVALSDARVLARWADAVILVLRSDHTDREVALLAREQFRDDGTSLLGTILTDWNPKKNGSSSRFNKQYLGYLRYYQQSSDD